MLRCPRLRALSSARCLRPCALRLPPCGCQPVLRTAASPWFARVVGALCVCTRARRLCACFSSAAAPPAVAHLCSARLRLSLRVFLPICLRPFARVLAQLFAPVRVLMCLLLPARVPPRLPFARLSPPMSPAIVCLRSALLLSSVTLCTQRPPGLAAVFP